MFDGFPGSANGGAPSSCPADALRDFVSGHQEALHNAATLLGGRRGAVIVTVILDGLAAQTIPSRRVIRAVYELRDLMTLVNVDDFDAEESARFAQIDPASPVVAELCLLTDGFCDAIARAGLNDVPALPSGATA